MAADGAAAGDASGRAERPGDAARAIMRSVDRATLSTMQRDADGWPSPSLVLTALDLDGTPLLLLSALADHTRNIDADARVGLLFDGTRGLDHPLAGARVSVLGRAIRSDEPRHRTRYLARHPGAALYADFADFAVYRVAVERAHLVAGFGRIHRIAGPELLSGPVPAALAESEAAIIRHMNEDHADAVQLCAAVTPDGAGGGWTMTGIDPDGCDLRRGGAVARLGFERPVTDAEGARAELVRLVAAARRRPAEAGPAEAPS